MDNWTKEYLTVPAFPSKNFKFKPENRTKRKRRVLLITTLKVGACVEARLAFYKKTELVLLNKVQSIRLGEQLETPIGQITEP